MGSWRNLYRRCCRLIHRELLTVVASKAHMKQRLISVTTCSGVEIPDLQ